MVYSNLFFFFFTEEYSVIWENVYNIVLKGEMLQSYVSNTIPILCKMERREWKHNQILTIVL